MKYVATHRGRAVGSILILLLLAGCAAGSPVERSAAGVLDSAGSVVRSGKDKLWVEPEATPIAAPLAAPRY